MQSVLIVDDHAQNLYFLEVLLQANGFAVRTAMNGAEALASARNNPPALIIADILMPVMDGYVLCREWRADTRLRQIPFIFYTATFTDAKDEELAMSLGADRFVVKPQEPEILLGIVREVLADPRSRAAVPAASGDNEPELLREYSETLFKKLEKKMADLETVNRELLESEQYFRHFVMECPVPIGVSDRDGNILLLNSKFTEKFGYTRDDIPNLESWWLHAYPDPGYRQKVAALWQEGVSNMTGTGWTLQPVQDFCVTCKDGQVRIMEISGSSILNRMMVVFNDLTDRNRAQLERTEQLQRHNDELEERVRERTRELEAKVAELDAFTSAVSHDLRSPLRRLNSFSQMLQEDLEERLEDADVQILQKISETSTAAIKMVDALLELSRLGKAGVVREEVNLSALANSILNDLSLAEPQRRHLFTVAPGLRATADVQLVHILLTNLLDNAWKFTANREETRISLTAEPGGHETIFCVSDNGAGFDMNYADKLFMPFQRLHYQDEFSGIGIGLTTVNSIVNLHGGRIWAESEPDKGARFCFTLGTDTAAAHNR